MILIQEEIEQTNNVLRVARICTTVEVVEDANLHTCLMVICWLVFNHLGVERG